MGILLALLLAVMLVSPTICLAKGRNSANAFNNRGIDLWNAHKYDAAIQQFDQAVKLNPRFAEAYSNRGAAYDGLNHPEASVKDYTKAISLNPRLTQTYQFRALSYYDLGRFDDAIKDWNVVLKRRPRDAFAFSKRAVCYQYSGNLQSALQDFDKAVSLDRHLTSAVKGRDMVRKALSMTVSSPAQSSETPATAAKPAILPGKPAIAAASKTPKAVAAQASANSDEIVISSLPEPAPVKNLSVQSEAKPAANSQVAVVPNSQSTNASANSSSSNSATTDTGVSSSTSTATATTSTDATGSPGPLERSRPEDGGPNSGTTTNGIGSSTIGPGPNTSGPSSGAEPPRGTYVAVPVSPIGSAANVVHHMVGNLLYFFHQFDGAYASYSQAAVDNPNDQFAYYRAGNALRAAGQRAQALSSYEMALRIKPNFKQAMARRAELYKELGPSKPEPTP